jgi:hypothetical protein
MSWLAFTCPGCERRRSIAPGFTYLLCNRCAAPHCEEEEQLCSVPGCTGSLHEAINSEGRASQYPPGQRPPVHYDP